MTMKPSIAGKRFGRLVAQYRIGEGRRIKWVCLCDCGKSATPSYSNLVSGDSKSCGCLKKELIVALGHANALPGRGTREYVTWIGIKGRCYNPNRQDFHNYGGRGIRVSPEWVDSYEQFLSDMGTRPEGTSIDRVDVNGDYERDNCRWATSSEQANNKRTNRVVEYAGRSMTVSQGAAEGGMSKQCLLERLDAGWCVADAIETPVGYLRHKSSGEAKLEAATV